MSAGDVTAVLPVKPWALSKSRLRLGDADRRLLARAFALDVLEAITASTVIDRLVVVTAEPELGGVASRLGAVVLADRPLVSPEALDIAVDAGRRWAMAHFPTSGVIVLPSDLPALTSLVLDHAVSRMAKYRQAYVPDSSGFGTTVVWARTPEQLHTTYGTNSAMRHSTAGPAAPRENGVRSRVWRSLTIG